jgi:hypothetical protein
MKLKIAMAGAVSACLILSACGGASSSVPASSEAVSSSVVEVASESSEASSAAVSDNPLLNAPTYEHPVLNGLNEKIGTTLEVYSDKAIVEALSNEQFSEFADALVSGSEYSYIVVNLNDGTCLQFTAGHPESATYGEMSDKYSITKTIGHIARGDDGVYQYTAL